MANKWYDYKHSPKVQALEGLLNICQEQKAQLELKLKIAKQQTKTAKLQIIAEREKSRQADLKKQASQNVADGKKQRKILDLEAEALRETRKQHREIDRRNAEEEKAFNRVVREGTVASGNVGLSDDVPKIVVLPGVGPVSMPQGLKARRKLQAEYAPADAEPAASQTAAESAAESSTLEDKAAAEELLQLLHQVQKTG
jgi:hypothetical protein